MSEKPTMETPETDAAIVSAEYIRREMDYYTHKFVLADHARRLERERDALREALREAMMDCDHMILAWPSNPYEWQVGVRKMQDKIRAVLGKGAG